MLKEGCRIERLQLADTEWLQTALGLYLVGPYMDISQKASIGIVKFQRRLQSYIRPVCAGFYPAGLDGIRGRGSHLNIGLDAPADYRNVPVSV